MMNLTPLEFEKPLVELEKKIEALKVQFQEHIVDAGPEIEALEGDRATGLSAAVFRERRDGSLHRRALRHLFLFIGADPNAEWVGDCVKTDAHGFIVTGGGALPLETSMPGIFAIGDVRAGSTKRVAAAVGEGAAVVSQIHAMLENQAERKAK